MPAADLPPRGARLRGVLAASCRNGANARRLALRPCTSVRGSDPCAARDHTARLPSPDIRPKPGAPPGLPRTRRERARRARRRPHAAGGPGPRCPGPAPARRRGHPRAPGAVSCPPFTTSATPGRTTWPSPSARPPALSPEIPRTFAGPGRPRRPARHCRPGRRPQRSRRNPRHDRPGRVAACDTRASGSEQSAQQYEAGGSWQALGPRVRRDDRLDAQCAPSGELAVLVVFTFGRTACWAAPAGTRQSGCSPTRDRCAPCPVPRRDKERIG